VNFVSLSKRIFRKLLASRPYFATEDVVVGKNVSFGKDVVFNCKRVRIGDGVSFGDRIRIDADVFEVGDYGTFYSGFFVPGPGELRIGHNVMVNTSAIIDAMGGTSIGNNVAVGARSQLWTHMKVGDVLYGCRFHSEKPLKIGHDVWISPNCLIWPGAIGDRALIMPSSTVTKNIGEDRTYTGNPAQDATKRYGPQFFVSSVEERVSYLQARFQEYDAQFPEDKILEKTLIVTQSGVQHDHRERIVFNVAARTYTKRGFPMEYRLMRFLLPGAKFVPFIGT
jgi:acetyltransferase-like isoleucine patch superfamily enzyme